MESGIYSITCVHNGKKYIGSTKDFSKRWKRHLKELENDSHHNIILQRVFNKYGSDNLVFDVVEKISYKKSLIIERENYYINFFKELNMSYNLSPASFGDVLTNHPNRLLIIEKIRKSIVERNGVMSSQEKSELYGKSGEKNGMFGKTHSEEARKKISDANKGNQYAKGSVRSEEHCKKLSELASERTGEKNPFYGKSHTEETKKAISEKNKGKTPVNSCSITIDNNVYDSFFHASKVLGIPCTTIRWRCLSKNEKFSNYFINAERLSERSTPK